MNPISHAVARILLLVTASVTGMACSPQAAALQQAALQPVTSLAGEWRVAGIDGKPLDEPYGLALQASEKEIRWGPSCANAVRSYLLEGSRFVVAGPPRGSWTPRPICAIAPPARLPHVMRVLDMADSIGRTPENGVLISGGGHSVLLFSQ